MSVVLPFNCSLSIDQLTLIGDTMISTKPQKTDEIIIRGTSIADKPQKVSMKNNIMYVELSLLFPRIC